MPDPFHVKCDRWDDCQRRLSEVCEQIECPYRDQHPALDAAIERLEARVGNHDTEMTKLGETSAGIREELAGMRGQLTGALAASKISGAVIGGLISAGVSVAVFFIGKK